MYIGVFRYTYPYIYTYSLYEMSRHKSRHNMQKNDINVIFGILNKINCDLMPYLEDVKIYRVMLRGNSALRFEKCTARICPRRNGKRKCLPYVFDLFDSTAARVRVGASHRGASRSPKPSLCKGGWLAVRRDERIVCRSTADDPMLQIPSVGFADSSPCILKGGAFLCVAADEIRSNG